MLTQTSAFIVTGWLLYKSIISGALYIGVVFLWIYEFQNFVRQKYIIIIIITYIIIIIYSAKDGIKDISRQVQKTMVSRVAHIQITGRGMTAEDRGRSVTWSCHSLILNINQFSIKQQMAWHEF